MLSRRTKVLAAVGTGLMLFLVAGSDVAAFKGLVWKVASEKVDELYDIFKRFGPKGYKRLTKSKEFQELPEVQRAEVLIRLAAKDGRVTVFEGEEIFRNLRKVQGFEKTAKWLLVGDGKNPIMSGAMYELRLANGLREAGYGIIELRKPFKAANKARNTDIDLLVTRGDKVYAIESKAHVSPMQWNQIAADAESLVHFRNANPAVVPYFIFSNAPSALAVKKLNEMGVKYNVIPDTVGLMLIGGLL